MIAGRAQTNTAWLEYSRRTSSVSLIKGVQKGFRNLRRTNFSIAKPRQRWQLCVFADASKVNILVVGGGGREHALSWKLAQSSQCGSLFVAPGNPGTALEGGTISNVTDLSIDNHDAVVKFCREQKVDLVVVGPEAPLVAGLADSLSNSGIDVFGPTAAAAQLEGSKKFLKALCKKYDIPTAAYQSFTDPQAAKDYVKKRGAPIVVKADGLAAGKGVVVAATEEDACAAVDAMLVDSVFGEAGQEIIIEDVLEGEEVSFFAIIDGSTCIPLASAQDHKAVGEGDKGPNTGGMGAYSPAAVMTPAVEARVMKDIVEATANAMVAEGTPFRGVLFAGLMITDGKAMLLEHNVRFGDPECQCLMTRLDSDLLPVLLAACGGTLSDTKLSWSDKPSLTVVMATKGYPGTFRKGSIISSVESVTTAKVFHAGTALNAKGQLVATGGRVLGLTSQGATILEAQQRAYQGVDDVDWPEGFCRRDIGWRAVAADSAR